MFKSRSRRAGFTLAEVLVTVAIIAIIAAAVVPAVTSQITKGDETTVITAVTSVRTSITAFVSDVRSFPQKLSQLTNAITTTDLNLAAKTYSTADSARWRGPYSTTATFAVNDSIAIGLGAYLRDLVKDSSGFVVLTIGGTRSRTAALRIEALFDATPDSTKGMIRWPGESAVDSISGRAVKVYLTSSK